MLPILYRLNCTVVFNLTLQENIVCLSLKMTYDNKKKKEICRDKYIFLKSFAKYVLDDQFVLQKAYYIFLSRKI